MSDKIENIEEWINNLYKEDNEYTCIYAGKSLKFQKRLATGVALKLENKTKEQQLSIMISMLSIDPHFTPDQAIRLPLDLTAIIVSNLNLDPELMKKKSLV